MSVQYIYKKQGDKMTIEDKNDAKKLGKQDREFAKLIKKLKDLNKQISSAESGISSLNVSELEAIKSEAKETRRAAGKKLKQYQNSQM